MHGTQAGAEMTGATGPRPASALWTPDQDALLKELWLTGLSCTEIGVRLGKTKSAVTGRAHRQMLPPRLSPIKGPTTFRNPAREAQQRDAVLKSYNDGVIDPTVISANTEIPRGRVVNILNRAGIKIGRVGPAKQPSPRLTQWKAINESGVPMEMPVYDVDPATLVAGVGGSRRHCQFIPGDPKGERTLYCGRPPLTGVAYCEHHVRICYRPHPLQVARQGIAE